MNSLQQKSPDFNQQSETKPHRRVEVLEVRPVQHGSVRAYVRIRVGAFTIAGCKVIQQPGQRPFVRLPDQQAKDGRWFRVVNCTSPTLESAISEAVLGAWREVQS